MVWFTPDAPRRDYAKQRLHEDEFPFFSARNGQLVLELAEHKIAPAICFESLQPKHAADVSVLGVDIYLASVAKPARGMARAVEHYPAIARRHGMHVIMANSIGPCDNFVSVGQSAIWGNHGELLARMDTASEGVITLDTAVNGTGIVYLASR
jgi:predicted amidohydrolase